MDCRGSLRSVRALGSGRRRASKLAGLSLLAALLLQGASGLAQASGTNLAKELANPLAALISVPLVLDYDGKIGSAEDGGRWALSIKPVIPLSLSPEWNLISRTILPVISQHDVFPGAGSQNGTGDVVQSLFISPTAPTADGWIWGAGPVFLLPTGSDRWLTADKWGIGPTAVALKQTGPWTYGALANHIVSFAGDDDRADINATYIQPFLAYVTATSTTFSLNTESTYDWENDQWTVPLNLTVSQMLKVGQQPLQVVAGVRYWADGPTGAPNGWAARLGVTFLFPK